ncbi:MAG: carbohydrate ABC transporter permease [Ruminococcus callidus]
MKKKSNSILGMAFFGPALVLMTVFLFIPMILTLIYSFTDYFALNPKLTHFVGLENFSTIFKDDLFTTAFGNTVKFVLIIVPLQTLGALGLALLINKVTVVRNISRSHFYSGGHVPGSCFKSLDADL